MIFLVSHFNFLFIPRGRLSWLLVSFLLHIKYTILSYRMICLYTRWLLLGTHSSLTIEGWLKLSRPGSAPIGWRNTLTLDCLACHITATSQLLHEVNKFLLAYIILLKRVNFQQYFICLCERIFNCCNVLVSS